MNVDFKKLSNSEGYKKLKKSVLGDAGGNPCFNLNGCNHKNPSSINCHHQPCSQFKWIIDRAKHYSHKTGIDIVDLLNAWEKDRSYWYQNYYQNGNLPKLTGNKILVLDKVGDLEELAKEGFRCPACNGVSKDPYKCNTGLPMKTKSGKCDWKIYGLFGGLGKGLYIFIKEKARGEKVFMPISLEKSSAVKP